MRRCLGPLLALGMILAACGDSDSSSPTDSTATSGGPTSSDVESTSVPETAPDSTEIENTVADTEKPTPASAPETTDAPEDSTPPTTTTPARAGWTVNDYVQGAALQGYSGNWAGDAGPSPAAPSGDDPPADGFYVASVREPWDPARPDELAVRIERLELCSVLPDGCENMDDPAEMNLDPTWHLDLDVPLDSTTDVIVGGFKCWGAREQKQATGVELADLFTAFAADYDAAIAPHLDDGTSSWDLANQIAASPTGGFVAEATMCPQDMESGTGMAGPLRYVHEDAPVLLLQTVTDWDGGPLDATDLVQLHGVEYTDGVPTYFLYAGFYS